MRVAVTGGAGFIGSHLSDALIAEGHEVVVIDDLSTGREEYVNPEAEFIGKDVRSLLPAELEGVHSAFHLAGDTDARLSAAEPLRSFERNLLGTFAFLECSRKAGLKHVLLASSSTVYGNASVIPTPETQPCAPISNYGASKLACEAYLSSYSASYGIKGTAFRFANVYGERSRHGLIHDLIMKLKADPRRLEVLGDGRQEKSYLHVSDCVTAVLAAWRKQKAGYETFNVGSDEKTTVDRMAALVSSAMKLTPRLSHSGGPGPAGDVRLMLLDSSKMKRLGWKAGVGLEEGINRCLGWLGSEGTF